MLPQGPPSALRTWVPRGPPPGLVPPNPTGSPAPHPPQVISLPRAGKCLTTHPLHLGAGPPHYLSIIQHNSLESWDVFLSLFNSFASAKCPPDIVCLQDPPFWRSRLPSFQNYTSFAPPGGTGNKPKVAIYVSTYLLAQAPVLPAFFDRLDVVALAVFRVDLFGKSFSHFRHFEFV